MSELKHWHPILEETKLNKKPISIKLLDKEIVIFKDSNGKISALDDVCPHRRMRLSNGKIVENSIQCPYHSWKIDGEGTCISPASGFQNGKANSYDVMRKHGMIWIRERNSSTDFPIFQTDGYHFISSIQTEIEAPLEIVLDNFTETEHTSSVHAFLGFGMNELKDAEVVFDSTESSTRLFNKAKQKKIPWLIRHFIEIKSTDYFIDDWTTYFSPVYTVYDQYWTKGNSTEERPVKLKIYVFFNPIDKDKTQVIAFTFMKYRLLGNLGLNLFIKPAMKWIVNYEVLLDKQMIESIANKEVSLKGTKLSKFDKSLGPNRNRIEKVYRQTENVS
ncbi:MAG: Rieske 2Fe-2S domain-containing protein [Leptospiraceae bacterium]|nr:Rieske 2Fe-2S domain-containing protein [Leptospiraceae bacterium]